MTSETSLAFGTSGLRGLIRDLTPEHIAHYAQAFLSSCPHRGKLYLGWDLRPSSPEIARYVGNAAIACGVDVIDCGPVATPALALAAQTNHAAAIMVTGSHLASDRNGLKFYLPSGEITKVDEAAILAACRSETHLPPKMGQSRQTTATMKTYGDRYRLAFGKNMLSGMRIGIYEHSSVASDLLKELLQDLGAEVFPFLRSEHFVPIDTEALDGPLIQTLQSVLKQKELDAIVSTDADADRPMMMDHRGRIIPGDVLGVLTARYLGADTLCTPVSSNDMIEHLTEFVAISRTRIGSPYVIAAMEKCHKNNTESKVVGYEANGGFLLGFLSQLSGPLAPLITRDCLLPILAPLAAAQTARQPIAALWDTLPALYTAADRLLNIAPSAAQQFLRDLRTSPDGFSPLFSALGPIHAIDLTDGVRLRFEKGEILHFRLSGNAPEFRIYVQAQSRKRALSLLKTYMNETGHLLAKR